MTEMNVVAPEAAEVAVVEELEEGLAGDCVDHSPAAAAYAAAAYAAELLAGASSLSAVAGQEAPFVVASAVATLEFEAVAAFVVVEQGQLVPGFDLSTAAGMHSRNQLA